MIDEINDKVIQQCLSDVYYNGTCNSDTLMVLSLCKYLDEKLFAKYEKDIILSMGLFYKNIEIKINERTFPLKFYDKIISEEFDEKLTPVQADIKFSINRADSFMFSAPTSIGKSFLLRDIVLKENGNVIIVVPTRALLNEYQKDLKKELIKSKTRTTNVLPFIENINLAHSNKNIYVLTPERCMELLKIRPEISLFVFDEAQLGDASNGIRSIKFRAMINKINNHYKSSKKIFAYPFVENLDEVKRKDINFFDSVCKTYKQRSVGQIFIWETKSNLFHALYQNGEILFRKLDNPIEKILSRNGRILVFCEKAKIYKGDIYSKMDKYISRCKLNAEGDDVDVANRIISKIEDKIGVTSSVNSQLVENLKRGVAIHHGSLPHEIRVLIEDFINRGFAQICFSTPTLEQGINLPFDLIYVDSFTNVHNSLDLKNLIGRAGRSSDKEVFDYGIVVFKNKELFLSHLNKPIIMDSIGDPTVDDDELFLKEAILENSLDGNTNLPTKTLLKMSDDEVINAYSSALNNLFDEKNNIKKDMEKECEKEIIENLCIVYKAYLHGRTIDNSERRIFFESVRLMIDKLQKKKFSQIVNERYSFGKNSGWERIKAFDSLPNKHAGYNHPFQGVEDTKYYFDIIVYDTFEYLDKNYNLFLKDVFYGMAYLYGEKVEDNSKNKSFKNLLKYGSDDEKDVMLFRYGFTEEEIETIKSCVISIDENEIKFSDKLNDLPDDIKEKCLFYKY